MEDLARYFVAERAAHKLLKRMHLMTRCGQTRKHWSSCQELVEAFGWESWEAWDHTVERYNAELEEMVKS